MKTNSKKIPENNYNKIMEELELGLSKKNVLPKKWTDFYLFSFSYYFEKITNNKLITELFYPNDWGLSFLKRMLKRILKPQVLDTALCDSEAGADLGTCSPRSSQIPSAMPRSAFTWVILPDLESEF